MNNLALQENTTSLNDQERALFNFLDHTVLLITQASNAQEIDLLMDDFMSDDVLKLLENNADFFGILNAVWLSTFKRIFIDQRSDSFPLKVLWLPVLFKQLNWEIEDIETFEKANFEFRQKTQNNNDLYKQLVELFLNGLKFRPETAYNLFKDNIEKIDVSTKEEVENITAMLKDIESLGWK